MNLTQFTFNNSAMQNQMAHPWLLIRQRIDQCRRNILRHHRCQSDTATPRWQTITKNRLKKTYNKSLTSPERTTAFSYLPLPPKNRTDAKILLQVSTAWPVNINLQIQTGLIQNIIPVGPHPGSGSVLVTVSQESTEKFNCFILRSNCCKYRFIHFIIFFLAPEETSHKKHWPLRKSDKKINQEVDQ